MNTRLILEHFLDDKKGSCNLEFDFTQAVLKADGHEIKARQKSGFTTVGVESAIHCRFTDDHRSGR